MAAEKERLILRYQSTELQSERLSRFKFGLHRADTLTDIASDQPHAHFFREAPPARRRPPS